jgi:hypothetical protein
MFRALRVNRLTTIQRLGITALAITILIALGIMLTSDTSGSWFAIGASLLASVIASFIALWINLVVVGTDGPDHVELTRANQAFAMLASSVPLLKAVDEHGVRAAKPKSAFELDEWRILLNDAHEELYIVGHALDKWCRDEIRASFVETIQRLVSNEKRVRLVALPPTGKVTKQLSDQRHRKYEHRIRQTLRVLASVHQGLEDEHRKYLDVRSLRDGVPMPYMVSGNENFLIVSAYPAAAQESGDMLAVSVGANWPLGRAIRADLSALAERHAVATNLRKAY